MLFYNDDVKKIHVIIFFQNVTLLYKFWKPFGAGVIAPFPDT